MHNYLIPYHFPNIPVFLFFSKLLPALAKANFETGTYFIL